MEQRTYQQLWSKEPTKNYEVKNLPITMKQRTYQQLWDEEAGMQWVLVYLRMYRCNLPRHLVLKHLISPTLRHSKSADVYWREVDDLLLLRGNIRLVYFIVYVLYHYYNINHLYILLYMSYITVIILIIYIFYCVCPISLI